MAELGGAMPANPGPLKFLIGFFRAHVGVKKPGTDGLLSLPPRTDKSKNAAKRNYGQGCRICAMRKQNDPINGNRVTDDSIADQMWN
jgi:hypothetical protein